MQSARGEDPHRRQRLFYLLVDVGSLMLFEGQLAGQRIVFHRDAIEQAYQTMWRAFSPSVPFTVAEARALLGSSRKFIVPLLEHFDTVGYTRRRGDYRVLLQTENGGE